MADSLPLLSDDGTADWHRRVIGRSLRTATKRSIDRGSALVRAAATLLERNNGDDITVQEVADEAGQSLRTLYQYFESKDDLLLAVFEEAMTSYARAIRAAIADLDDPTDRLAGAIIAALRIPERSPKGMDRGLVRLRLKLSEAQPELVGRSQAPLANLLRELVADAAAAGGVQVPNAEAATYMLLALKAHYITSDTLGNDTGLRRPDVVGVASFCLRGLGADLPDGWFERLDASLRLPAATRKRAPRKR